MKLIRSAGHRMKLFCLVFLKNQLREIVFITFCVIKKDNRISLPLKETFRDSD